jgi:hypothetical protein
MMVRLNTRHELPQIAIRQTQGRLDESAIIQPQIRGTNRQAQANKGFTQPSLSMDSYQSRKAYGFRNHGDEAAEQGSRGLSDIQAKTSRLSQEAWQKATTAARRGNDVAQNAKAEMSAQYEVKPLFTLKHVPNVKVQVHPGEVVGKPDLGECSVDIETAPSAKIRYTMGSVEIYLKNEGFVHHWVTQDHYDIYA